MNTILKNCLLLCTLMIVAIDGRPQQLLTLEDAIAIGLEKNYDIKISRNQSSIEKNNYTIGNAGFLPTVTLQASQSYTNQDVKQEFLDGRINERNGASSDILSAGASLNWVLFDGLKMFMTYDKLNELRQAGAIDVERAIENTIYNISLAYYRVILEKNKLSTLDTSILLSEERLEIAKSQYEVGKASKLEYMTAQVDYNEDRSAQIQQKELLNNAKIELNRLMSRNIDEEFIVTGQIEPNPGLVEVEMMEKTLINNKDLAIMQKDLTISNYEMQEINAEKLPVIQFNFGYNYSNLNSESGFLLSNRTDGITYGVSAVLPIFNGFNVQRRVQNARIEIVSNEYRLEQLKLQIKADVKRTYANYRNNLELLELEQENFQVALENAEIALERYKLGNSNALELREAQVNAVEAVGRLIDASFNTKRAELDLLLLSGQLLN